MADSNVYIVVKATDLASDVMAHVQEAIKKTASTTTSSTQEMQHDTESLTSSLAGLGNSFVARVAEGLLLRDAIREVISVVKEGIEAFPQLLEHTVAVGNSLFDMSMKTGASVEGLSALRYVASQTGIDFNTFGTTLSMLEKNLGATGAEADKVKEALGRLGLDMKTLKDERPDQAFIEIAQALSEIPNNADKANIAATLMGRGAKEMAALWHESIDGMIQDAQDLGLIMSTETAAAAHAAEIGFQALSLQVEALGFKIAGAFLPAIIGLEQDLGVGLSTSVKTLNSSLSALGSEGGWLSVVARAMGTGSDAVKAQIELYDKLKSSVLGVASVGQALIPVIAFTMVGFDALSVITNVLVNYVNDLALAYNEAALAFEKLTRLGTSGAARQMADIQIASTKATIDQLNLEIKARSAAIDADKQAETDWMTWSTQAQTAVAAGLKAVGETHHDVAATIQDFAAKSRAAYGGIGSAIQGSTKDADAYAKKWVEVDAEIQKTWGEAFLAQVQGDKNTIAHQIDTLEQRRANDLTAAATKIQDEDQLQQMIFAIDAKYDALELDAYQAFWAKHTEMGIAGLGNELEQQSKDLQKFNDGQTKSFEISAQAQDDIAKNEAALYGDTEQSKIDAVQKWLDKSLNAIKDESEVGKKARADDLADAQSKVALIIASYDPLTKAWQSLNVDMRNTWASTWEQALDGSISFGSAFATTLQDAIEDPFKKMLAGLLADWEQQLLGPMIGSLQNTMSGMFGMPSRSSTTMPGAGLGGLFGGGDNGPTSQYSTDAEGNVLSDASGNPISGSAGVAGGLLGAGAGTLMMAQGGATNDIMGGLTTGASIGSIVPGIGTAIGAGIGAIAGGIKALFEHFSGPSAAEKAGRSTEGTFEQSFGGFDQMSAAIGQAYVDTGRNGAQANQDILNLLAAEKQGAAATQAAIDEINLAFTEQKAKVAAVETGVSSVVSAFNAAGGHIPDSMKATIQSLLTMKGLTDDEKKSLSALVADAAPDYASLTSMAATYGISLDALGPKFQQANIDSAAKKIFDDFTDLSKAGGNVGGILSGMSDEISKLVDDSIKFGTAIPENMKPLIQNLIDAGKLLDDNGKAITSIAGISFEDTPVDNTLKSLNDTLQLLIKTLSGQGGVEDGIGGVASALAGLPTSKDITVTTHIKQVDDGGGDTTGGATAALGGYIHDGYVQHLATGGNILRFPGRPSGIDTVPIWAAAGEGVITRAGMSRIGSSGLAAINNGGAIGGDSHDTYHISVVMPPAPASADPAVWKEWLRSEGMEVIARAIAQNKNGNGTKIKRGLAAV